jgi:hypothetical protein
MPFTIADYRTVANYQPLVARWGGSVTISDKAPNGMTEAGYIAHPWHPPFAVDVTFWRGTDGLIHADLTDDTSEFTFGTVAEMLEAILSEWEAMANHRAKKAGGTGLGGLPGWLR